MSNELVVIPQRAMREADKDYAVAFAIPVDTPGLKLVCRGLQRRARGRVRAAGLEPRRPRGVVHDLRRRLRAPERVFLCGEWEYAGDVANTFANVNRQGYLGADVGKLRLFIGAAQLVAELNGVADVAHIRDKITQMIRLERAVWACGVAASLESSLAEPRVRRPRPRADERRQEHLHPEVVPLHAGELAGVGLDGIRDLVAVDRGALERGAEAERPDRALQADELGDLVADVGDVARPR